MINDDYVVAAVGDWNKTLFDKENKLHGGRWYYASDPAELNQILKEVSPRYIFFPHWRWIVPKLVFDTYECICFHMTDVPYGRGGSPLQNLIVRGHKKTVLTALKMEEGLDTGPVYFKEPMSLEGTAQEIYQRTAELAWKMIATIIYNQLSPTLQRGEVVLFERRKPEDSRLPSNLSLEKVFDYIRMLDAPDYPRAFLEIENYRFEFEAAKFDQNQLTASVKVSLRTTDDDDKN